MRDDHKPPFQERRAPVSKTDVATFGRERLHWTPEVADAEIERLSRKFPELFEEEEAA